MNRTIPLTMCALLFLAAGACAKDDTVIATGSGAPGLDITLTFEKGQHYTHPLKINRLITIDTTPQIAVWIERPDGTYVDTLYVTKKAGTQGWRSSPDLPAKKIRRPESLPCWSHRRGVVYPDGLFMPTKNSPVTDALTAASPSGSFHLMAKTPPDLVRFIVLAEINNSADFNEAFPADAVPGSPNYSGGAWGSGQPSVIYAVTVDRAQAPMTLDLVPIGHGSPDGTDGAVSPDLSGLTTAKDIIRRITVSIP